MGDKCGAHSHRNDPTPQTGSLPVPWSDGRRYWRSLDELAGTPQFLDQLQREFPRFASEWPDDLSRRNFLKVMGASLALASAAGCFKRPEQEVAPYVQMPEMVTPGVPLLFATAMPFRGYARGVMVKSYEGRPTKIDGNPAHPASLGATDSITQAMVLSLYDPFRAQAVKNYGIESAWNRFIDEPQTGAADILAAMQASGGDGLYILSETITSPTLGAMLSDLFKALPKAKWFRYDAVSRTNARKGAAMAFGQNAGDVQPVYQFDKASRVLSLDANFLADDPGSLRYARDFINQRRVRSDRKEMNRLYVVEGTYTITGAMADHRMAVKPSRIEAMARYIAAKTGVGGIPQGTLSAKEQSWLDEVIKDLPAGQSIVIAGDSQPPVVHALVHAINDALGNTGKTLYYIQTPEVVPAEPNDSLADLTDELNRQTDSPRMLLILEANPVYTAPADVDFKSALEKFSSATVSAGLEFPGRNKPKNLSVRHGIYNDETSAWCQWHLPSTVALEDWGDLRAYDGTVSFQQPLIAPLYNGRSALDLFGWLMPNLVSQLQYPTSISARDRVRDYWRHQDWQKLSGESDFKIFWEKCLDNGVVPGTAFPALTNLKVDTAAIAAVPVSSPTSGFELVLRADPNIFDGRYANNGWLQELPKPLIRLTWDNAVLLSRPTAKKLGVNNNDLVTLTLNGRTLSDDHTAVWILPGLPDDTATVYLGYGRTRSSDLGTAGGVRGNLSRAIAESSAIGTVDDPPLGTGPGFNAYVLRTSDSPDFAGGLEITKAGGVYHLASIQGSQSMEGRDLLRVGDTDYAYKQAPEDSEEEAENESLLNPDPNEQKSYQRVPLTLYPETPDHANGERLDPEWQAWGMVIDNNACIGCNACVTACQAENNISVVGKDQVTRGRDLLWIRLDTYFAGPLADDGEPNIGVPDAAHLAATDRGASWDDVGVGPGQAGAIVNPDGTVTDLPAEEIYAYFQPVPCMQCEKAPCELVCPVGATIHDVEGINNMVYNRCIGTRYCSNNCPYKVRRFNFLQ
ncbi:MAG TPA: TAT-variant-translocated molybdopterin oxidoreductase, partial [Tepidisphaeraceae bacterium]|nr:TAT-variant-translocated molybdopterin oxidoreductase [Tepidisphaeraceae bacterium]